MAASGTLVIRFIGDLKEFERATGALGKKITATGSSLTKGLTLPLVAAGAGAVKLASDFEHSMGLIEGVVGVSRKQIEHFSDVILTEGPKWGKSPQELADALYFVTSSGFAGAEALDILEHSAKASTAGLGEVETIADLVTSAINAYGKENLNAAQTTDILAKAIDLGKLESEEFAGVMGRVLPVASAMGVEFDEAAAAMSAMSMSGTDASEGATQLRGIFAALLKPTVKANETLKDMGLSAEGLRAQLEQKGLLSVLDLLTKKFDGNEAATAAVFGNVRALTGVMNMMGANVDQTRSIFGQMEDATGSMDSAFKVLSETTDAKFEHALAQVKASLITVGMVLLPLVAGALEHVTDFLHTVTAGWQGLDDGTQKVILGILGFIAAVGPVLLVLGKVFAIVSALANPVGLVVTAIVLLVGAFAALGIKTKGIEAGLASLLAPFTSGKFASAVQSLAQSFMDFGRKLLPTLKQIGSQIMAALGPALASIADVIATKFVPAFKAILPIVAPIVAFLLKMFGSAIVGVIKGVANVIVGLVTVISGVFNLIVALVHGDWSGAWDAVKDIVKGAVQLVWGLIQTWLNIGILGLFKQAGKLLLGSWRGLWKGVRGLADDAMKGAKNLVERGFKGLGNLFVSAVKAYLNLWVTLAKGLLSGARSMWSAVSGAVRKGIEVVLGFLRGLPGRAVSAVGDLASLLVSKGRALLTGLLHGITNGAKAVWSWLKSLPSKAISTVGDLGSVLLNAGRALLQGLLNGITEKWEDVKHLVSGMGGWIADHKGPLDKDKRLLHPAGIAIMKGLLDGLTKGGDSVSSYLDRMTKQVEKVLDKRYDGKALARHTKAVMASLRDEFAAVRRNAKAYEQWKADLKEAREALAAAKQEAREFADSVRDGFVSFGDVTQLGGADNAAVTSSRILEDLRKRAAEAQEFARLIATLADEGLNDTSLQQLLAAGVESGLATAQAIALGGAGAIGEINSLTAQIAAAGAETGNVAAQEFYGAGIQAAQGLVDGLVKAEPDLIKIAERLGDRLANAIRKALKIHSPSQVFAEIGALTAAGLVAGLMAGSKDVEATAKHLAQLTIIAPTDSSGVGTFTPRPRPPGGFGGGGASDMPSGPQVPLIGQVIQQPGESVDDLAERLWFKTRTRG